MKVLRVHADEAPQIALQPGAQAVRHRHAFQVGGIAHVGLVRLVGALRGANQPVVGLLLVVDYVRALLDVREEAFLDAGGRRLAAPADDGDGVLPLVDRDGDAELLARKAAPARLPGALGEVGVGDVRLVYPGAALQHDPVLVPVHRREHAVPPFPGGLVRYAAHLGGRLDGDVPRHELDESRPGREILLAVLEHRVREGAEAGAALGAPVSLAASPGPPVFCRLLEAAPRALRARPVGRNGLVEGTDADLFPAFACGHGPRELVEILFRERINPSREPVGVLAHIDVPSARTPIQPERRQT